MNHHESLRGIVVKSFPMKTIVLLVNQDINHEWISKNISKDTRIILVHFYTDSIFLHIVGYDHDIQARMNELHRQEAIHLVQKHARNFDQEYQVETKIIHGTKDAVLQEFPECDYCIVFRKEHKWIGSVSQFFLLNAPVPCMVIPIATNGSCQ
jgi:nucleotide-binding universal stress UspA family protein